MTAKFECKHFKDLNLEELYRLLQLRQRVFIVEQACAFLDNDDLDQASCHLMCYTDEGTLAAYCRLLPVDLSYVGHSSIGRVVSEPALRREGYGRLIMQQGISICKELFGTVPIKIGAQLYLQKFYESFGFARIGETYLEDGIDHIKMILHHDRPASLLQPHSSSTNPS